jgi:hypothetical protein
LLATTCGSSPQPVSPTAHGRRRPPRSVAPAAVRGRRRSHSPRSNQHTMWWGSRRTSGIRKRPTRRSARRPRKRTNPLYASPSGVRCRGGRATDWTPAHAHGGPVHRRHRARSAPDLQGTLAAARGAAGCPVARPGSAQDARSDHAACPGARAPQNAADPDRGAAAAPGARRDMPSL